MEPIIEALRSHTGPWAIMSRRHGEELERFVQTHGIPSGPDANTPKDTVVNGRVLGGGTHLDPEVYHGLEELETRQAAEIRKALDYSDFAYDMVATLADSHSQLLRPQDLELFLTQTLRRALNVFPDEVVGDSRISEALSDYGEVMSRLVSRRAYFGDSLDSLHLKGSDGLDGKLDRLWSHSRFIDDAGDAGRAFTEKIHGIAEGVTADIAVGAFGLDEREQALGQVREAVFELYTDRDPDYFKHHPEVYIEDILSMASCTLAECVEDRLPNVREEASYLQEREAVLEGPAYGSIWVERSGSGYGIYGVQQRLNELLSAYNREHFIYEARIEIRDLGVNPANSTYTVDVGDARGLEAPAAVIDGRLVFIERSSDVELAANLLVRHTVSEWDRYFDVPPFRVSEYRSDEKAFESLSLDEVKQRLQEQYYTHHLDRPFFEARIEISGVGIEPSHSTFSFDAGGSTDLTCPTVFIGDELIPLVNTSHLTEALDMLPGYMMSEWENFFDVPSPASEHRFEIAELDAMSQRGVNNQNRPNQEVAKNPPKKTKSLDERGRNATKSSDAQTRPRVVGKDRRANDGLGH